jgi:hypothetical protein
MNRLAIVSLISLPIGAALTVPAGATTGVHFRIMGVYNVRPDQPNSNIVGQGSTAKFKPKKLTSAEDTSGNMCDPFIAEMSITNTGTKTAYITYAGAPFFKLKKGTGTDICWYGGQAGDVVVLNLSNKANTITYAGKLTITLSS